MQNGKTNSISLRRIAGRGLGDILLVLVLVITLFPLIYTLLGSFKSNMEILVALGDLIPKQPTLDNYTTIFQTGEFNVGRLLLNSIYYTVGAVIINVLVSSTAGYVFDRGSFPCKKIIFAAFSILLFIKTGGLDIYPKMNLLSKIHLNKGIPALLALHLFSVPIVNVYLVRSFVRSLPRELDEAAEMDGCSFIGTFFRILLPLLKPILATIAILSFQGSWNDYLMPTIFTSTTPEQRTLIVGLMALKSSDGGATNWNLMLAGTVIALLPVLVVYIVGNRFFVSGLAAGAVKG